MTGWEMSGRDNEILRLFREGSSTREIADQVGVSQSTASRVIRRVAAGEPRVNSLYVRGDHAIVREMPEPIRVQLTHALYRFYDQDGVLLYVGISGSLTNRLEQHAESKSWFHQVANIRVEHFAAREALESAEKRAILAEKPRYNKIHNDPTPWRQQLLAPDAASASND